MRFLIFIVLMLGVTGIACAQMTDAQVIEAVKSAQAQEGKSQDEIILMLSQKGVTKEQVLRIRRITREKMQESREVWLKK
ncbi:MAG: hypothetical protein V8R91_06910 [Butyricimonas faecihominis]